MLYLVYKFEKKKLLIERIVAVQMNDWLRAQRRRYSYSRCKKIRTLCFLEIFQDAVLILIVMRLTIYFEVQYHYILYSPNYYNSNSNRMLLRNSKLLRVILTTV